MKVSVSTALIEQYKSSKKNYNYMLDFFLNSLDLTVCAKTMNLLENFQLAGEKQQIEIDSTNISAIKSAFGKVHDGLIECLIWMAVMLPEI